MDSINLPNVDEPVEVEKVEAEAPPEIQVLVNNIDDAPEKDEIFKSTTESAPAPKKKRQLSQAQLDNLAKMREKRAQKRAEVKAEKEAAEAKKAAKIPANAIPVPKQPHKINEPPPMPTMNSADGFMNFMEYMEKYKGLKDSWKKREIEKAKRYMANKEPEPEPKKTVETKVEKKPVSKTPSLLSNHAKVNNTYSDYF